MICTPSARCTAAAPRATAAAAATAPPRAAHAAARRQLGPQRQAVVAGASSSSSSAASSYPYPSPVSGAPLGSAPDAPRGAAAAVAAERRGPRGVLEDCSAFLKKELEALFTPGGEVTRVRYSPSLHFQDPITRLDNLDAYILMVRALKTLFSISFELHTLEITGQDEITARWTMTVDVWPLLWRPTAVFTGRSKYKVDTQTGLITSHVDTWDALTDNSFLSLEALAHLMRQALDVTQVPRGLETPQYRVLRAARDYEVRSYPSYLVAEAPMGQNTGPAGGAGCNDLARYIFGGNSQKESLEMTTPVLTEPTEGGARMSFVMEDRFPDVGALPAPLDPKVTTRRVAPQYVAASRFSGWAFDWEVDAAERALRAALLRDGLNPGLGYKLARYNEPTAPPFLRRNEVLIELQDYAWP